MSGINGVGNNSIPDTNLFNSLRGLGPRFSLFSDVNTNRDGIEDLDKDGKITNSDKILDMVFDTLLDESLEGTDSEKVKGIDFSIFNNSNADVPETDAKGDPITDFDGDGTVTPDEYILHLLLNRILENEEQAGTARPAYSSDRDSGTSRGVSPQQHGGGSGSSGGSRGGSYRGSGVSREDCKKREELHGLGYMASLDADADGMVSTKDIKMLDADGDGTITGEEIVRSMQANEAALRERYDDPRGGGIYDVVEGKKISIYDKGLDLTMRAIEAAETSYGRRDDGSLADPDKEYAYDARVFANWLNTFDDNGDGTLEYDEFDGVVGHVNFWNEGNDSQSGHCDENNAGLNNIPGCIDIYSLDAHNLNSIAQTTRDAATGNYDRDEGDTWLEGQNPEDYAKDIENVYDRVQIDGNTTGGSEDSGETPTPTPEAGESEEPSTDEGDRGDEGGGDDE